MSGRAQILVIGGGSRIAAALAPLLGDRAAFVVRRHGGQPNEIRVRDYAELPATIMGGADCVINCAGVSTGDAALLNTVNVALPCRVAAAARAAGARQMIHISSFSIYGRACAIDRSTPPTPVSDYGRSKLAGDLALLAQSTATFSVTILRLPLIYGEGSLGKLGQLLRWWSRLRLLPVPADDVARAMIGVELAAQVIAQLATAPRDGVVLAADPQPFTYRDAARARGETLIRLPVPRWLTRVVESVAPSIGGRLFADSRLVPDANFAVQCGFASRLYQDIAAATLR